MAESHSAIPGSAEATPSTQRYVLWGNAGHAKVLASLIALRGGRVEALFDDRGVPTALRGIALYTGQEGFQRWVDGAGSPADVVGLAATGGDRGRDRLRIQELFRRRGPRIGTLIHPDSSVCACAVVGPGTQVLAQAVVAAEARIGEACILNHRAAVDHECAPWVTVFTSPQVPRCAAVSLLART